MSSSEVPFHSYTAQQILRSNSRIFFILSIALYGVILISITAICFNVKSPYSITINNAHIEHAANGKTWISFTSKSRIVALPGKEKPIIAIINPGFKEIIVNVGSYSAYKDSARGCVKYTVFTHSHLHDKVLSQTSVALRITTYKNLFYFLFKK